MGNSSLACGGGGGAHEPLVRTDRTWEKRTVNDEKRMRLNGESAECMAHARKIQAAGGVSLDPQDGSDTSVDQRWEMDRSPTARCADRYILYTSFLWLGVKCVALAIPMLLLQFPAMVVVKCYAAALPEGADKVDRTGGFWLAFLLAFLLHLPAGLLAFAALLLDYLAYWVFGVLYCACTCRWAAVWRSMRAIDPYRDGPWLVWHMPDFLVCAIGQTVRQGLFEVLFEVSAMWLAIPWLKYYVNCNPWIHDLDHRMVTQLSTEMADVAPIEHSAGIIREIISRSKQRAERAARTDLWSFVPHYPYPPPGRRYALGLQVGGGDFPKLFTLITHTTHAHRTDGGSTEQLVLANSAALPVYRVMLWYNNPYHFLTGWVEASITNGQASQPEKCAGGEHPMWLVSSRTPLLAGRDKNTFGPGMIDAFFDYWLPVFIHEVRYSHYRLMGKGHAEALRIANAKYQEVHSEDRISRPIDRKLGLDKYNGDSALEDFGIPTKVQVQAAF